MPRVAPENKEQKNQIRSFSLSSGVFLAVFTVFLSIAVFVLPWHVPLSQPAFSQSYTYGFNNFAALLGIALFLAVMLLWLWLYPSQQRGLLDAVGDSLRSLMPDSACRNKSPALFWSFVGISVFVIILNVGWLWLTPRAYILDATPFLSKIDMLVMGLKPYRDFQFSYGPLMLYGPYWMYKLSGELLSIEEVHAAFVILNWVLGLYLLYYILSCLQGEFSRVLIFWIVAVSFLNPSFAACGTPLRFLIPIASVLGFHRLMVTQNGQKNGTGKLAVAALFIPFACFSISPEMGLAAWFGMFSYLVHLWTTPLRRFCWTLLPVFLSLAAIPFCFSTEYWNSLLSFSGGGNNFPIYPIPGILYFFLAVFCVIPQLVLLALQLRDTRGSVASGLFVTTGLLIAAALGRADTGHVLFNGIGIFLLFLAALSRTRKRTFHFAVAAYGFLFIALVFLSYRADAGMLLSNTLRLRKILSNRETFKGCMYPNGWAHQSGLYYSKMLPAPSDYLPLLRFPPIGIPTGCDENLERFLKLNGKLQCDYYMAPVMEIYLKKHLTRKLADLDKMRIILVLADTLQVSSRIDLQELAKADSEELSSVLGIPIKCVPRNEPFDPDRIIALDIQKKFSVIGTFGKYVLMQRKTGDREP